MILLQRLMETVLFFHPVVWYVSRQLSFERESCCDDLVVHAGCESVRYASTLIRMAELCAVHHPAIGQPLLSAAAANGGNGSDLKRRVVRLLSDPQRLRLTRGDSMTLLLIAALTIGAITGVWRRAAAETDSAPISASLALMTQEEVSAPDKAKREVADRNDESEFSGKVVDTNQSAKSEIAVRGVVLKPDGKPAVGAVVRAAAPQAWEGMQLVVAKGLESPLSETIADSQGMFSIRFPRHPFGDVSGFDEHWRDIWKKTQIAASLTGYGPAWVTYGGIDTTQALTLRLVEDLPLRGRVIDLEGRPIAGTSVKVMHTAGDEGRRSLQVDRRRQGGRSSAVRPTKGASHRRAARDRNSDRGDDGCGWPIRNPRPRTGADRLADVRRRASGPSYRPGGDA